jgi:hypothetical protein
LSAETLTANIEKDILLKKYAIIISGAIVYMNIRIAEFDWLKTLALLLLIFAHSDLYFVFPEIINPLQWFLLSCFFFVSGFLAFDSFNKCGTSIQTFFRSKILSMYAPFVVASIFYFFLQTSMGAITADPLGLLANISLLNVFEYFNAMYNWGALWFIPYLMVFMLILSLTKKYIQNVRAQILIVTVLWFCTIMTWVYDSPIKVGMVFSQYFLVFMVGVWFNEFKMYDKVMKFRTALITVPVAALFSINLSFLFTFNTTTEAIKSLIYSNGRSLILSLSLILLVLTFLRKLKVSRNRFIELVATNSVLIYLMEPFFSYILRSFIFGQLTVYFITGTEFYLYQIARIAVLLVLLPFFAKVVKGILLNMSIGGVEILHYINALKNKPI